LRQRRMAVRVRVAQAVGAAAIDTAVIAVAVVTIATGAVGVYELLMVLLLARPMWDFVQFLRDMAGPASADKHSA